MMPAGTSDNGGASFDRDAHERNRPGGFMRSSMRTARALVEKRDALFGPAISFVLARPAPPAPAAALPLLVPTSLLAGETASRPPPQPPAAPPPAAARPPSAVVGDWQGALDVG